MVDPVVPDSLTRATWSLTWATWGLVAAAIGGMIFTFRQLGQERDWRRGEKLAKFRELFDGGFYSQVRRSLAKERLAQRNAGIASTYQNIPATAWRMLDLCESICREVDNGRLGIDDGYSEFSEWIVAYSTDFAQAIVDERNERKDESYYSSIRSVRSQLEIYCKKRGSSPLTYNTNDIKDFYETELESSGSPL
jgi:hypothetical protein